MPVVPLAFDPKDPADTDGFAIDITAWLGADTVASATATATGLTVISTVVGNPSVVLFGETVTLTTVTAWISGGQAGVTYTVTFHITTASGRSCYRSVQLPVQTR